MSSVQTAMGLCLLCLLPSLAAGADEVSIRAERGVLLAALLERADGWLGTPILYPEADGQRKRIAGRFDMEVERPWAEQAVGLILSTCGVRLRRFGVRAPLLVALAEDALPTRFRLTGCDLAVEFDRPPSGWRTPEDRADSLDADTAGRLIAEVERGEPTRITPAAHLLSHCGPRGEAVVNALLGALERGGPGVRQSCCDALAELGFHARKGRARMRAVLQRADGREAERIREALAHIESAMHPALLDPSSARRRAPDRFTVRLQTTEGDVDLAVVRDWSPEGADRIFNLVEIGFFDGAPIYRVVRGFVAQWGKHPVPRVNAVWFNANIPDEERKESNRRGTLCFAQRSQPNTRGVDLFINLKDNPHLDKLGFTPVGRVVAGMEVVDRFHADYGERVDQGRLHYEGAAYLRKNFPALDVIESARILKRGD
jgi:peptidyl-prolyl cis-trans isomerase A (cyclophilin A)